MTAESDSTRQKYDQKSSQNLNINFFTANF